MLKKIFSLFGPKDAPKAAIFAYQAIVSQSRAPEFYSRHGVPDSLDGRFDMIVLHTFLVMRRLGRIDQAGAKGLSQELFDLLFADMDNSLREIGVGDLGVGRKVKAMAQAFFGRIEAYESGINSKSESDLIEALRRNLYGTVESQAEWLVAMAAYARAADAYLATQSDSDLMAGKVAFPAPGR